VDHIRDTIYSNPLTKAQRSGAPTAVSHNSLQKDNDVCPVAKLTFASIFEMTSASVPIMSSPKPVFITSLGGHALGTG